MSDQDEKTIFSAFSSSPPVEDEDPRETAGWLDALAEVIEREGAERARYLLSCIRRHALSRALASGCPETESVVVGLSRPYCVLGSVIRSNEELIANFPGRTAEEIFQRTGIKSRRWAAPEETPLTMAIEAAKKALAGELMGIGQIDAIICATTTPICVTPSLACLVHHRMADGASPRPIPCYDLFAACSGYLYALRAAYDYIRCRPRTNVLVVTAEVLSRRIDPKDFDTAVLFGDAATATVVYGPHCRDKMALVMHRPVACAKGDDGSALCVPLPDDGPITMDGRRISFSAVRCMASVLQQACAEAGIAVESLDLIIPHQANGRITRTLRAALDCPEEKMLDCIRDIGNAGSSGLPFAMSLLDAQARYRRIGVCTFGGGLTYGAAILESG
jgi:2-oxoisovalerate dehydrogenase E1 component